MPTTPRWGLPYPQGTDLADVPARMQQLAVALDDHAKATQGVLADRPAFGFLGTFYHATDTGRVYFDTGTSWLDVGTPDGAMVTNAMLAANAVTNAKVDPAAAIARSKLDFGSGLVNADIASGAAIAESKLSLASDAAAGTASRRTLGTGATQACAGNDARLSDQRVPTDGSVTKAKLAAAVAEAIYDSGDIRATAKAITAGSEPSGWLLCDGRAVSRTTYATLYTALGGATSPHGQGDGSTTFNLPDYRGRTLVGVDGAAGRLTANDTLGANGGEEKHVLTIAEMPSHTHPPAGGSYPYLAPGAAGAIPKNGGPDGITDASTWSDVSNTTIQDGAAGGGGSHNNMQPYSVVNYLVKT